MDTFCTCWIVPNRGNNETYVMWEEWTCLPHVKNRTAVNDVVHILMAMSICCFRFTVQNRDGNFSGAWSPRSLSFAWWGPIRAAQLLKFSLAKKKNQLKWPQQNSPANSKFHRSLQNCGSSIWNSFIQKKKNVDPCCTMYRITPCNPVTGGHLWR